MPRGAKSPSELFNSILSKAAKQLLLKADIGSNFGHKGIRGDERAGHLVDFLSEHLPKRFAISKGESIDFADNRTGQLDILVYDTIACAPLLTGAENILVPAESLYVTIEVKSVLTKQHIESSYSNAGKLKRLLPYKKSFVAARKEGLDASDKRPRCLQVVFAYTSDLKSVGWASAEYGRIVAAAGESKQNVDAIDRVFVLDRGIIIPGAGVARTGEVDPEEVFFDFYLHFSNFIFREQKRREPIDWQIYGPRTTKGWKKI